MIEFNDYLESEFHIGESINLKLNKFKVYFQDYSKKINLTSIRDEEGIILKQFIDSIIILKKAEKYLGDRIVEIGSGGGFPGLVASIIFPEKSFLLMDSINKKAIYLKNATQELLIKNTEVSNLRAEEFGKKDLGGSKFDTAIARSVAYLPTLAEYIMPLLKIGGYGIIPKELPFHDELEKGRKAIDVLGGTIVDEIQYSLPRLEKKRVILIIKKIKKTPKNYPREIGKAKKEPIK